MSDDNKLPDDTLIFTQIDPDHFGLYSFSRPDGLIDPERTHFPVLADAEGSFSALTQQEQGAALKKSFWDSYKKEVDDHFRSMNHQAIDCTDINAELVFPDGPFDEQIDLAEMFTMGISTCFKIKLKDGRIYPVIFETYKTIEDGVKQAEERGSFLYPYPCQIILCHVGLDTMRFSAEMLGRTNYFSHILADIENYKPKIIDKSSETPTIKFNDGSTDTIYKQIIDGVEVVSVTVVDNDKRYRFNFFDLEMIKGAMGLNEDSKQRWMFFSSPNMVILKELTTANIQKCINELYFDGVLDYYGH